MANPNKRSDNPYSGENPTVALIGGLPDGWIGAIIKGDAGVVRTLTAATLDSVAADFIENLNFDSGRAISSAVCFWKDAKQPGAGNFTLATTWSGTINNVQMQVLEYEDVDQSTPISTIVTNTEFNQANDATVTVTLAGQSGETAISWVAIADSTSASASGKTTPSANLTSLTEVFAGQSRLGVGEDVVVASASEAFDWDISQDGTVIIDSTVIGAFAIFGVDAGVTGTIASTLDDDTSVITGVLSAIGTIASTLEDDTSVITGIISAIGTIASTLEDDTSAIAGLVGDPVTGTIASTLDDDTSVITGVLSAIGTIASTLDDDTGVATGVVGNVISGTIASTLDDDTSVITGIISAIGTIASTLDDDTSVITGVVGDVVVGTIASTLDDDTGIVVGIVGVVAGVTGTIAAILDDDTSVASGLVGPFVAGEVFVITHPQREFAITHPQREFRA